MSRLTKLAPKFGTTAFLLRAAEAALAEARAKHPQTFVDYHHMMGVLDEEIFEVRMEVHRQRPRTEHMQSELLQVIAVCLRALEDLTLNQRDAGPTQNRKKKAKL